MKDSFASRLKYFRVVKGYSQQELSKISGVSRKQISDLELGSQKNPRESTQLKLANALDVDIVNFIPNIEIPEKIDPSIHTKKIELDFDQLSDDTKKLINHRIQTSGRSFNEELNIVIIEALNKMFEREKKEIIDSRGEDFAYRISELEKQFALLVEKNNKKAP